jgi:imidazolonepropionase-like amidohydrolase
MPRGPSSGEPPRTLVRASWLIDGTGAPPRRDGWLLLRGAEIVEAGAGRPPHDVDDRIELTGGTLLPGLIDAHSHLGSLSRDGDWLATLDVAAIAARIFENCRSALLEGFTCVRDAGGLDGGVAAAITVGLVQGPRVLPSGPALLHADAAQPPAVAANALPGLHAHSVAVSGPEAVREAAALALARGATQVKVIQSGSLAEDLQTDRFSTAELAAAVEVARSEGTYVLSHAFNRTAVQKGLDAGVFSFEHCFELDPDMAERMRSRGAAVVVTLSILDRVATQGASLGFPAESVQRSGAHLGAARAAVRVAASKGVLMGSGSDLVGSPQTGRALELSYLAEEIGPVAAISASTLGNARILGLSSELGTLEPTKTADVVGVRGDPTKDPELLSSTQHIALVIQTGRVVQDSVRAASRAGPLLDETSSQARTVDLRS